MAVLDGADTRRFTNPLDHARGVEWPTWAILTFNYAGFGAVVWFWNALTPWIAIPLAAYLICLNTHVMHEVLHGHPTRSRLLNRLFVLPNFNFYIPYEIYRDLHIAHHKSSALTDPMDDPESFYVQAKVWDRFPALRRQILTAGNSLIGRMLIGPPLLVSSFWWSECRRFLKGETKYLGAWVILLANNAILLTVIFGVVGVPVWQALLAWYAGLALMTVRSFIEHRPAEDQDARCAIVEGGPIMGTLFLNNCFHLVHHDQPDLPWYEIPRVYRADVDGWRARTKGHWFTGYWDVLKRYGLTPKDTPRHPYA
jgi:fatty acid desaturase